MSLISLMSLITLRTMVVSSFNFSFSFIITPPPLGGPGWGQGWDHSTVTVGLSKSGSDITYRYVGLMVMLTV